MSLTNIDMDWIVDSGISYYAAPCRDLFTFYKSGKFGVVHMDNKGTSKIIGIGSICIENSMGVKLILKEVRNIPDLRMNLLSMGVLDNEGYTSIFGK